MKITEIINEGPMWDKLKGAASAAGKTASAVGRGAAGAVQGYKQSQQNRTTAAPINKAIADVTRDWTTTASQLKANGNPVDETMFAQFMKVRTPSVAPPSAADVANPAAYIKQAVSRHFANRAAGVTTYTPTSTAATPSQTTARTAAPLAQMIHQNPDIIRFEKISYVSNDQGLWTPINSNKPVQQSMQEFLTQQADKLTPVVGAGA